MFIRTNYKYTLICTIALKKIKKLNKVVFFLKNKLISYI